MQRRRACCDTATITITIIITKNIGATNYQWYYTTEIKQMKAETQRHWHGLYNTPGAEGAWSFAPHPLH